MLRIKSSISLAHDSDYLLGIVMEPRSFCQYNTKFGFSEYLQVSRLIAYSTAFMFTTFAASSFASLSVLLSLVYPESVKCSQLHTPTNNMCSVLGIIVSLAKRGHGSAVTFELLQRRYHIK
jgi:hypothetical protein